MALALNFCPDINFLDRADAGHKYFHFDDKDKSILSVFWYMIHRLEAGESTCLVLESQKDAEFLYYLISRYQLSELCLILSGETPEINNHTLVKIKDAIGNNEVNENGRKVEYNGFMQHWNAAIQNLTALNKELVPGKTAIKLIDKLNHNKALNTQAFNAVPSISLDRYKTIKASIAAAEKMYLNCFNYLDVDFPFYSEVLSKYAYSALTELLDEKLDAIESILQSFAVLEKKIFIDIQQSYDIAIKKIKKEIETLDEITVTDDMSESNTILQKREYHFKRLLQLYNDPDIGSKSYDKNTLDLIKANIYSKAHYHSDRLHKNYNESLSLVHHDIKYKDEAGKLMESSVQLVQEIVDSKLIKSISFGSATQLMYQKQLLTDFKNKIASALHFLDNNESYYSWCIFMASLDDNEKQLITMLADDSNNWPLDFDRIFFNQLIASTRLQLDSPTIRLEKLKMNFSAFVNSLMENLKTDLIKKSGWETLESLDWDQLLEKHAQDLVRRFPLLIVGRKIYVSNKLAIEKAFPQTMFYDSLCENIEDFAEARNVFLVTENKLVQSINKRLAMKANQWIHIEGPAANINRPLDQLNRSELHKASMHIANELDQLNAPYRIFQLRNLSIISYWTDIKNAKLIAALNPKGIKEIISDSERINLLPAIFSNLEQKPFILIEDGLFVNNTADILRQLNLLDSFRNAQVEVINIDNVEFGADMNKAIEKIELAAQNLQLEPLTN